MSEGLTELRAMESAYAALEPLDADARRRAARWLVDTLGITDALISSPSAPPEPRPPTDANTARRGTAGGAHDQRSPNVTPSPKVFISAKRPAAVAERVACLAFYLTHYRNMQSFGGGDIATLNTEAAAPRLNTSRDLDNADRASGYLVSAGDRKKQITARGEALVAALPDREAVKAALQEYPHKKRRSTASSKKRGQTNGADE